MNKIVILDEKTANQIAAGEVIERPASVVKEMVENSIDAGSDQITVEIKNGGISYIRITDNGSGMEGDDAQLAFERHATSKMRRIEDLDGLSTMGFRGEALASIASVSHLKVTTKTKDSKVGTCLDMEGGQVISVNQVGCPKGTTFIVKDLFYNTPVRFKFLKKDSTEAGYVSDILERLALAHPHISFKFIQNGQVRLHTPGNNDLLSVLYSIYGKDVAKAVLPVNYQSSGYFVTGFVGKPEISRGNRRRQSVFINGRYIKSHIVSTAAEEAYKTMLMQNKFPFYVLFLKVSSENFDVNVHPQKLEVRFSNEREVYSAIYHGVKNALLEASLIRDFESNINDRNVGSRISYANNLKSNIETRKPQLSEEYNSTSNMLSINNTENNTKINAGISTGENTDAETITNDVSTKDSRIEKLFLISETQTNDVAAANEAVHESYQKEEQDITQVNSPTQTPTNLSRITANERMSDSVGYWGVNEYPAEDLTATQYELTKGSKEDALLQLKEAYIVGQAFNTYILLQNGHTLYIIDQHAAHERIRYETLKKRLSESVSYSQGILEPIIINLQIREFEFVMEKQETFKKLGFEIEAFGANTIILRSIPDFYNTSFSISDFHEIMDRWMKTNSDESIISDEVLYTMSCKGALKANKALSKEEMQGLVQSLCSMGNPWTCVHGRPVIIKLDKKDFEKKFKRIV